MNQTKKYSIKDAYLENIRKILAYGEKIKDERGSNTLEILNLQTNIEGKLIACNQNIEGSIWTGEKLEDYCKQMNNPEEKGFAYDYGNRLRGFDVDQIQYVIDKLSENPNSRRSTAVTWRPTVDTINDEVPCLIMLDFKIRHDKLSTTAVWRSHDIYGAFYPNLQGLKHISDYIAHDVGCSPEIFNVYSLSAHIYETDIAAAQNILMLNNIIPPKIRV